MASTKTIPQSCLSDSVKISSPIDVLLQMSISITKRYDRGDNNAY